MSNSSTVFLPMVSSETLDLNGLKQLWGTDVLASTMIYKTNLIPFFNPTKYNFNGYAYDGRLYQYGGLSDGKADATWATEDPSDLRGNQKEFPDKTLVIVTDVGITMLSLDDDKIYTWMIFLRGDYLGFSDNPDASGSYTPREVYFDNGMLYILNSPDPGSFPETTMVNVIDFTTDSMRMFRNYEAVALG